MQTDLEESSYLQHSPDQSGISWIDIGSIILWFSAIYGSLALSNVEWNWGYSICGPWGCGPPLQALVGCHLAWLVALLPLALGISVFNKLSSEALKKIGTTLLIIGAGITLATIAHERLFWWPDVSEEFQVYFWQRAGFMIATNVDMPMIQLMAAGLIMMVRVACKKKSN